VLYLAEVLRKNRVIGSGKAEFKLLACQRSEQQWSAVSGEEIVAAPDDVAYAAGALVMVELSSSKQVQRHSDAGRQLVSILQNFSRLQEKSKTQGEEIEQWKESLTYQSQELNRREMEMEARLEELQQMEEKFQLLEPQQQELEAAQQEIAQLREEYDRKSQELEGAWAHLQGEMNRFQEQQEQHHQSVGLDEGQAQYLQELLSRISETVTPIEAIQDQLNLSFASISQQQSQLDAYWQNLEQHKNTTEQFQGEADRQKHALQEAWQAFTQAQSSLDEARIELQSKQEAIRLKQDCLTALAQRVQESEALHLKIAQLAGVPDPSENAALENMPLEELLNIVKDLEKDLEKLSRFVHSQEEELTLQQEAIDGLSQQMGQASEYDRLQLEAELAEEQDRYQMLNQTLVGQRRNLLERQAVLKQHQTVLAKRQGIPIEGSTGEAIDLTPILAEVEQIKHQQTQEMQDLEGQIQELQTAVEQMQKLVEERQNGLEASRQAVQATEEGVRSQTASASEQWGKVQAYQEMLQPMQDGLVDLRHKAEAIASVMTQFQEAGNYQLQAIAEMRSTLEGLGRVPELVA
jgi:chromosome segregation ATPase